MQSLPEKAAGEPGADKQEPDESLKPLVLPAVTLAVCFLAIVCGSVSLVTYMSHAHRAATDMFVDDVARMMKQSLRSFDPVAALTPRLTAMASSAALLSAVNGTGQPCGAFTSSVFDPLAAAALGPTGEGWVHWVPRVAQQQREKWESTTRNTYTNVSGVAVEFHTANGTAEAAPVAVEYFPVALMHPTAGREAALLLDLATTPSWLECLHAARDTATVAVCVPGPDGTPLPEWNNDTPGAMFVAAAYDGGFQPSTIAARRDAVVGFAVAMLTYGDMFFPALDSLAASSAVHRVHMFDGDSLVLSATSVHSKWVPDEPPVPQAVGTNTASFSVRHALGARGLTTQLLTHQVMSPMRQRTMLALCLTLAVGVLTLLGTVFLRQWRRANGQLSTSRTLSQLQRETLKKFLNATSGDMHTAVLSIVKALRDMRGARHDQQQLTTVSRHIKGSVRLLDVLLSSMRMVGDKKEDTYRCSGAVTGLKSILEDVAGVVDRTKPSKRVQLTTNVDVIPPVVVKIEIVSRIVLALLSNAVKYTRQGEVTLQVTVVGSPDSVTEKERLIEPHRPHVPRLLRIPTAVKSLLHSVPKPVPAKVPSVGRRHRRQSITSVLTGAAGKCLSDRRAASDVVYVRIAVTDTGCGMTEQQREACLDGRDSGIGLCICASFAQQYQGKLHVESVLGEGTRCWCVLTLPKADPGVVVPLQRLSQRLSQSTSCEPPLQPHVQAPLMGVSSVSISRSVHDEPTRRVIPPHTVPESPSSVATDHM